MSLSIVVMGRPAPQGSKKSVGNNRMVEMSKYVRPWRRDVEQAARDAMARHSDFVMFDGPIHLEVVFWIQRPKKHYGTGKNAETLRADAPCYCQSAPDLSKLVRSTEDALTAAGVWKDDARVVVTRSEKRYVDGVPGAHIRVSYAT
jgi:crossover junction endodeoxyribonuclease RusA